MRKTITKVFLSIVLLMGMMPQSVFAAENVTLAKDDGTSQMNTAGATVQIHEIIKPSVVLQGEGLTGVGFLFTIAKGPGEAFAEGETAEIETNLGTLFDGSWSALENNYVKDSAGTKIVTVSIKADKVVFTIEKGAVGSGEISGEISTIDALTAKDVGATVHADVKKNLIIGDAQKEVTFQWSKPDEDPSQMAPVDIDVFWKNAGSIANNTGAAMYLEVNPIGSMDLYGSATYPKDKGIWTPKIHGTLFIKDQIPEKGYVDLESMKIYASVPAPQVRCEDQQYNWYNVPARTYYAQRKGTIRCRIDKATSEDAGQERMKALTQESNETLEQFEARVKATSLSWGVYRSEDKTETFMCNFGRVGDPNRNNGIKYSDFGFANYLKTYPEIFGDSSASGGNIVSYYIEFDTYYPDIVGEKKVTNYASRSSYENDVKNESTSGNSAVYTINNGNGTGVARKNELAVRLVDADDKTKPISGAEFKILQKDGADWKATALTETTDENGMLTFGPFPSGTYKVVQSTTAKGYKFDNTTYGDGGNDLVGKLTGTGEFTVTENNHFGFGTVVTNQKNAYHVAYEFASGTEDQKLPREVTDLLPVDSNKYEYNATVHAIQPKTTTIKVSNGIWKFVGYDKNSKAVTDENLNKDGNIWFKGTWKFALNAATINHIPTINAKDKTLTVGDPFDPLEGVTAFDEEDGELALTQANVVSNTVDMKAAGEYAVTYQVSDSNGASAKKTIAVTVNEKKGTATEETGDAGGSDAADADATAPQDNTANPDTAQAAEDTDGSVQTGDTGTPIVFVLLLVISALTLLVLLAKRKRKDVAAK